MNDHECPGLLAEKLDQWLAAVGATFLAENIRLSWSDDTSPCAVLHGGDSPPVIALHDAWPTPEAFAKIPIVDWNLHEAQDVPLTRYGDMTRSGIGQRDSWALAAAVTDLAPNTRQRACAARGPLNPGFPGRSSPQKSIHSMLVEPTSRGSIAGALNGTLLGDKGDGLGLDPDRFQDSQGRGTGVSTVYPVQVMAFYGLTLFPLRGGDPDRGRGRQRGWITRQRQEPVFRWPAWRQPLDWHAIDALLDAWNPTRTPISRSLGTTGAWETVRINRPGQNPAHSYASRRLH